MFQAKLPPNSLGHGEPPHAEVLIGSAEAISKLIAAVKRQAVVTAVCALTGLSVGLIYVLRTVPLYTATASVMLDLEPVRVGHGSAAEGESASDTVIESQVELFNSEKIGLSVIRRLNLTQDPAFGPDPEPAGPLAFMEARARALWAKVKELFGPPPAPFTSHGGAGPATSQELVALGKLSEGLKVSRIGRTAVLEIDYKWRDPERAAEIANEFAAAYIREHLDAHAQAARGAADWLKKHTDELREMAAKADAAAQKFRAEHNLTKGTVVPEQQLNSIAAQLVADRAATAQAKARYLRLKNIMESHQTHAAVAESLSSPVINDLQLKYLDYARRIAELERKVGPDHAAVVNMRHAMDELSTLLFQELGPVLESYRNEYEVALAHERATAENLERQRSVAIATNDVQVQLQQLEQEAASYRALYEANLKRYRELMEQETFPVSEARLVVRATAPLAPSHPRKSLALAVSLALGGMVGGGIGFLREMMDRVFRTADQVRAELHAMALGLLPLVRGDARQGASSVLRCALDEPFSDFAETLRSAKVAADAALEGRVPKVIGFVSLLPKEGKSTVAMNFASLVAAQGASTLLVDADTRNPGLTRAIGLSPAKSSRGEPISSLPRLVQSGSVSGLQLLPCFFTEDDPRAADGLSPALLQALFQGSGRAFDYVVVDLPPIGPVVNARCLAPVIDAFILVVEWGATSRGAVRKILEKERAVSDKLLGVLLNKVKMKALRSYEHFDSDGYYVHKYRKYYRSARQS